MDQNVFIGANVIINHDCKIKKFTTIGHGANLAGNVIVNEYCSIGISSVCKQNVLIEKNVIIGCGANIIRNVKKIQPILGILQKKN